MIGAKINAKNQIMNVLRREAKGDCSNLPHFDGMISSQIEYDCEESARDVKPNYRHTCLLLLSGKSIGSLVIAIIKVISEASAIKHDGVEKTKILKEKLNKNYALCLQFQYI